MSLEELSIGNELKDSYKTTEKWVSNGIAWLSDIDDFYKERATIEREYATKLRELTKRHFDKKAKMSSHLSVGESPTITPGSLESASVVLWNEVLTQTENIASQKDRFALDLSSSISGNLAKLQAKLERLVRHMGLIFEFLETEKKATEDEVAKAKKQYDALCQNMETARQKNEKSGSEKHQQKARGKEQEMNIGKNAYLIKLAVANRMKDKYYFQDLPELADYLQDVNETRVAILNKLIKNAGIIERNSIDKVKELLFEVDATANQNDPRLDSAMFVKHNATSWVEPPDFTFVPCDFWHDDEQLVTTEPELTDLKRRLNTSLNGYATAKEATLSAKQKLEEAAERRKASDDKTTLKFDAMLDDSLTLLQRFMKEDAVRVRNEVEIELIQNFAGDQDLSYVETKREKKSRFGLFKSKKTDDTGSIHTVTSNPASELSAITGNSGTTGTLGGIFSLRRSETTSSSSAANTKVLYAYEAQGDDEVSLTAGDLVEVVEADDGSGWTLVRTQTGQTGMAPTSYLEITETKKKGPAVAPKRGAKRVQYMEALYDYSAAEDNELTIAAGDRIAVVQDDADGWTEGEIDGRRGLFPTAYAKAI